MACASARFWCAREDPLADAQPETVVQSRVRAWVTGYKWFRVRFRKKDGILQRTRVPVPVLGTHSMTRKLQSLWEDTVHRVPGGLKGLSSASLQGTWGPERTQSRQSQGYLGAWKDWYSDILWYSGDWPRGCWLVCCAKQQSWWKAEEQKKSVRERGARALAARHRVVHDPISWPQALLVPYKTVIRHVLVIPPKTRSVSRCTLHFSRVFSTGIKGFINDQ